MKGKLGKTAVVEISAYAEHFNFYMKDDKQTKPYLPIDVDSETDLFDKLEDGVLLCKLVNLAKPGTINHKFINTFALTDTKEDIKKIFKKKENLNLAIQSAKTLGVVVINIHPHVFLEKIPNMVCGLIWQILKLQMYSLVDVFENPNIIRLKKQDETEEQFHHVSKEAILLRWINYHAKNGGYQKEVKNFSSDLKNGEAYTIFMHQLDKEKSDMKPLSVGEGDERSKLIVDNSHRLGCPPCIQPHQITSGDKNFNLIHVANLFQACPGLDPLVNDDELLEWLNFHLDKAGYGKKLTNFTDDLKDGTAYVALMNRLDGNQCDKSALDKDGLDRANAIIHNGEKLGVAKCLEPEDIVDGKPQNRLFVEKLRHNYSDLIDYGSTSEVSNELLNWANYHLGKAGYGKKLENFGDDLKDGEAFTILMNQLEPKVCDKSPLDKQGDERAAEIIDNGKKIGANTPIEPSDITSGNEDKNKAFMLAIKLGHNYTSLTAKINDKQVLKWMNGHLKASNNKEVSNFGDDLKDGVALTKLMHYLDPAKCDESALEKQGDDRSQKVLDNAENLGAKTQVHPSHITSGDEDMGLLLVNEIRKVCPDPIDAETPKEKREEKVFCQWTNSLTQDGLTFENRKEGMAVGSIKDIEEFNTGCVLLKLIDKIQPGLVDWKKVQEPKNTFIVTQNCNYGIDICKKMPDIKVVAVGGEDFQKANKKLMCAVIWQLMRKYQLSFLGGKVDDKDIVQWGNEYQPEDLQITKFADTKLANCHYYFNIVRKISPSTINDEMILPGKDDDELKHNAQYAISLARMLGSPIFVLWEQLKDCEKNFCMIFTACLKVCSQNMDKN